MAYQCYEEESISTCDKYLSTFLQGLSRSMIEERKTELKNK